MTTNAAIRIANDSPFCKSRRSMKKLEDDLISDEAMHAPLHEIERMMRTAGRELMREMMQAHFDRRSAQEREVDVRDAGGVERCRIREGRRTVMTEFGEVSLDRKLYQAEGAEALAPLDAAMELPDEKYSPEVRRIVAEQSARASFDEVVELVKKQSGAEVPKRQAEELAVRAARDFDELYRSRLREPEDTDQLLVLSFDAKDIATLHRDLREATRKKAETTPRRLETRLTKGEKPNRKRMAEVATVYSIDAWPRTIGDVLHGVHDKHDKEQRRPRHEAGPGLGRVSSTGLASTGTAVASLRAMIKTHELDEKASYHDRVTMILSRSFVNHQGHNLHDPVQSAITWTSARLR